MKLIAMAMVLGTLLGCTDEDNQGGNTSELEGQREQFEAEVGDSYTFTWRYACGECLAETNRPVHVTVVDNAITAMVDLETQAPVTAESRGNIRTIAALFDYVEAAEAGSVATIDVTYDPTLGYPATLSVDAIAEAADDEFGLTISNVVEQ